MSVKKNYIALKSDYMAIEVKTLEDMCSILKRLISSFYDLFVMSYNGTKVIKIEEKN